MLKIESNGKTAVYSSSTSKWQSQDILFQRQLNKNLPRNDDFFVGSSWLLGPMGTHGHDGIALQKVIDLLGKENVNLIEYAPDPLPKDDPDIVY